jgi:NTE family protein
VSRALVLGGGGVAGIGWETGVLYGLSEHGVDLAAADLVIGTSAGSAVGAQLRSGTPLSTWYDRVLDSAATELPAVLDVEEMSRAWATLLSEHKPGPELRAAIGRYALAADTPEPAARRAVIEARVRSEQWPESALQVVAVEAQSGQLRVFTRDDGVSLVDAVAASCAVPGVWPAVCIDGRAYIDGGVRTTVNLDLALGHDRVLVLAPLAELIAPEPAIGQRLAALHEQARVVSVAPDAAARAAIGTNPLDPSRAGPAARAGREQAGAVVAEVRALWG